MAPLTRVSAKAPEAPGPQGPPELDALPQQGVPDQGQPAPGPAALGTLTHEAEVSRLQAIIAETKAKRNASDAAAAESEARRVASDAAAAQSTPQHSSARPRDGQQDHHCPQRSHVNNIFTNKFEPWNLIRLHPILGLRPSPDEAASNVDITAGAFILMKKKTHRKGQVRRQPRPLAPLFQQFRYMYIYERLFGTEHRDVLIAMNRFLEFITSKSQQCFWSKCLAYAMRHHQHVKDSSIHNAKAWLDHPQIPDRPPSSRKRQRSETTGANTATREVCRKFNSQTGCSYRNCKRSHECSSCGGSHAACLRSDIASQVRTHDLLPHRFFML
ncbi:hypothetical protein E4U56_007144 [Claviceps arundinis]|uniref:C3H1-type domain-containing protein n=1 Tax=Claviceps arundinis TaxID=1623583 RepID=A0A9P7MU88_9HYPO|nr:hypothetical protein E4U56_007144 [Claviceps arundinis]